MPLAPVPDPSNSQRSYIASLTAPSKAQSMAQKPAMSQAHWDELSKRIPCMQDFKLGPAPAPLPYDTYDEWWLKLVWMEEYCSMVQFKQDHASLNPAQFNSDAFLTIRVNSFDQEEEAYRCFPRLRQVVHRTTSKCWTAANIVPDANHERLLPPEWCNICCCYSAIALCMMQ